MRILSLLPSATEVCYLLGLETSLVGVTHECDWPPAARTKRQVSSSMVPVNASPAEIDRLVSASARGGPSTIALDREVIRELAPDLVITQDLCAVSAVPSGHLREALDGLGLDARVVSLDPTSLDDVLDDIVTLGDATGTGTRARSIVASLRGRLATVRSRVEGRARPRTFALEWGDPPYNAGHWVPEMIDLAGGEPLLAPRGVPSVRLRWEDIEAARPEVIIFMPCGYDLTAARTQAKDLLDRPQFASAGAFYAADANGYFSQPGPRLIDGVEAMAALLHDIAPDDRGDVVARLR